jgi:predicted GNAT family acetyltransferase
MEVQHELKDTAGLFYVAQGDHHVAEMRYSMTSPSVMDIYHTEVSEDLQGKHIGRKLIEAGVDFARKHHYKIHPSCSFAQNVFETTNDFDDVLA